MIIDTPFVYFHKNTLYSPIIDRIKQYVNDLPTEDGVLAKADKNNEMRKSTLRWIERNQQSDWIYNTVKSIASPINDMVFQFDLTGIDTIQYTEYNQAGDMYNFHADSTPGLTYSENLVRKLTMVIQLTDSDEYEGGDVEFMSGRMYNETAPRGKGSIVIFPSYVMHRVTPIISGTRNSLVTWFMGPKFR